MDDAIYPTREEAQEANYVEASRPMTFIQWKGTDVCMDVYCKCGESFHIDGYFAYSVECPYCNRMYACGAKIVLREIKERPEWGHCVAKKDVCDG